MDTSLSLLVVVPTLNSYQCLDRLTSSLQSQSFKNWRLLFVDGPSSPEHRVWLEKFCFSESRASWIQQLSTHHGIFGAMNQGFSAARPSDWLLFWGSDDWAASSDVLSEVFASLKFASTSGYLPDLIVCRGRYFNHDSGSLTRSTSFQACGFLTSVSYRRALLLGSTPPHQATFFGPGARRRLYRYADGYKLSADLDYFLQLSCYPDLCVQCLNLELVYMSTGGVSGLQTKRRLAEVRLAYRRVYGFIWLFPFLMRYLRRMFSLLSLWN